MISLDPQRMDRWQRSAWIAAIAGLGGSLAGLWFARPQVVQAYWVAWIFWSGLSFGSLIILMLHALSGGAWGEAVREPASAGAMTLPLMAVLFLPAMLGAGDIFPWLHATTEAGRQWPHQQAYLTVPWVVARGLLCLVVMSGWTVLLGLWRRDRRTGDVSSLSAGGLIVYVVFMLFVSTDWIMSLEPHWYSTMLVVIFAIGHLLSALAMVIFVTIRLSPDPEWPGKKQLHDLGNLLLAFVMFWAYITFSQYLITWSGNLPREISWYRHRSTGGWPLVTMGLMLTLFAVPFAILLSRSAKRHRGILSAVAALVLVTNAVHVWWLIAPSLQTAGLRFPIWELATLIGVGGVWTLCFLGFLRRQSSAVSSPNLSGEVAHA